MGRFLEKRDVILVGSNEKQSLTVDRQLSNQNTN